MYHKCSFRVICTDLWQDLLWRLVPHKTSVNRSHLEHEQLCAFLPADAVHQTNPPDIPHCRLSVCLVVVMEPKLQEPTLQIRMSVKKRKKIQEEYTTKNVCYYIRVLDFTA